MSIDGDLQRARTLACAADEFAARDLLLSLMPRIEAQDRDDLLLEVFGQLGDIYLTRGAIEGAQECVRRIDDCLAIYAAIRDGKAPHLVAQVTMPDADIDVMMRRYSCRATYLHTAIHAARGDHDGARTTLAVLYIMAATPRKPIN